MTNKGIVKRKEFRRRKREKKAYARACAIAFFKESVNGFLSNARRQIRKKKPLPFLREAN